MAIIRMKDHDRLGLVLNIFNRIEHAERTAGALAEAIKNLDGPYTLIVVCDGARTSEEESIVSNVVSTVCEVLGGRGVDFILHRFEDNQGLSAAVRFGADQIFLDVDYAVFIEDDIVLSPRALRYFSAMRSVRDQQFRVWSVSGFTHQNGAWSGRSWYGPKFSSWGWATWRDRWHAVDWSQESLQAFVSKHQYCDVSLIGYAFNAWFGSDTIPVAIDTITGKTDSWAIKFMVQSMAAGGCHVYPPVPLVSNWGWDGTGRHCPPSDHLQGTPVTDELPRGAAKLNFATSWWQHWRYIQFRSLMPNKWTNRYHAKLRRSMQVEV